MLPSAPAGVGKGAAAVLASRSWRGPNPPGASGKNNAEPSTGRLGAAEYPAIIKLWENAWAEFVPFLSFDVEIHTVICSTNAIESVNARIRKAVRARGHFPTEAAALKCIYMALMSLDPTGKGRKRWTMRWKAPLNAFQIAFEGRLTPTHN
ncbi:transposase [Streptomyces sp. NPDC005529]|uniref:transposase n=1 Tax=unclassified Streptomyces TaxID=2593676 RepID=UPI0033B872D2